VTVDGETLLARLPPASWNVIVTSAANHCVVTALQPRGSPARSGIGLYCRVASSGIVKYTVSPTVPSDSVLCELRFTVRFTRDAAALDAADLKAEVQFGTALLALVHARAPQGTLYGRR
jgi:hypothetical protein